MLQFLDNKISNLVIVKLYDFFSNLSIERVIQISLA